MANKLHILILAAGQGKRMCSKTPKVLHPVLFQPMLHHVLDLAYALPHETVSMVVGNGENEVKEACKAYSNLNYLKQNEQLGTGHAVMMAEGFFLKKTGSILILSGDVVLLRKSSIKALIAKHSSSKAACTFVTANLQNPSGYGRILRNKAGNVFGVREDGDASASEKEIKEVNSGIYCFEVADLFRALKQVRAINKQKEYYLTDVIELFAKEKKKTVGELFSDAEEIMGINDRVQLAVAERILQSRVNLSFMQKGVTLRRPESVLIDKNTQIESDVTIESDCVLINSKVEEGSYIKQGSYIEKSEIGKNCTVGPYAHLRPGTLLKENVKIGNFVELKKSVIGQGSKASHLSYIGDAKVGKNVNIGCGFITCNYDGTSKFETVIEDDVFIGSDSQTIAPVTIKKGSYVASGTTVTDDVPIDSLVISRGRQVTKPGYKKRITKDLPAILKTKK